MESEEPSAAKPQKPSVPITIDVESDDEPGAKDAAAAAEPEKPPPEKKTPKVIPVDEDEDDVGEKDTKGEEQSPVEEKASPRKRKAPEVIALDEDDDDERVVAGKVEGEGDKKGDGVPEVVSEVSAEEVGEPEASVEVEKVDTSVSIEDEVQKSPEKVEEDKADVDCDSKVEETPTEKELVAEPSVEKQSLVQAVENTEEKESSDQENKPEPTPEQEQQISAEEQTPKATTSSDDCDPKEVESAELDRAVITAKTDEAAVEEEKLVEVEPAKTSAEPLETPDSTVEPAATVEIDASNEEKNKSPEPPTKCEDPEEHKSVPELGESTEAEKPIDLDDDVEMVETEKVSVKHEEPAKPAAAVDEDDDDVVMVSVEPKPSEPVKVETSEVGSEPAEEISEKKEEGTAEPVKTEQDDDDDVVEVVEPKLDKPEEKIAETEVKKELSDDCKKEESAEPTEAQEVAKVEADSTKSEDKPKVEETPSEKIQTPDEKSDADKDSEKTFELDEKSGEFLERDTKPEEAVPQQLITGDSDEDVVMVENDSAKAAGKPETKVEAAKPAAVTKPLKEVVSVECINPECKHETKEMAPAANFVLNFLGLPKKAKKQRICVTCFDGIKEKYEEFAGPIVAQHPLLFCEMPRKNELVEISDSSEEEEDADTKSETEKPLPEDIVALIDTELNDILTSTFEKINLEQQIEWTEQIMKQKIAYNTKISDEINNELNELQRKVDRIHLQLYSKSRPKYQDLPPCNIFHEVDLLGKAHVTTQSQPAATPINRQYSPQKQHQSSTASTQQAPAATAAAAKEEFVRPAVIVGQFYFAVKHKLLSNWAECQVVEAVNVADKALYKVNFLFNQGAGSAPIKVVPAKYLAYRHSFNVKLPLGTRVIARFDAGSSTAPPGKANQQMQAKTNAFYPGIIAESFGKYNRHRYLIFFDDGYAQYVSHGDVRVVCEESKEVWADIHPHSQEFIKAYLQNYRSQRPMVQVKVGQRIITEWKGKWIYAKVVDIDASLVQLFFPDDNRHEWIYRGSTRLGPLYQEKALSMTKANNKFSKFQKRNEPSIEYITLDDDDDDQNKQSDAKKAQPSQDIQQYNKTLQQTMLDNAAANRSVAKKSTFNRPVPAAAAAPQQPSAVFMNSSTIYCEDDRPKGKIVYYTAKKHLPPLKYKQHQCSPSCLFKITHNLKSYSPLAKPLLSGWERQLCKMKYKKVFVVYRGPCGRRLRNMYELHMYLRMTNATLNVENFDFDPVIHCLAEYVIENHIYHNPDLSDGKEYMAVPCVNYFDDTKPPPCIYSTERIPTEGVNLNLDEDFMCGCDCEDDCIDKSRCQCWQLTVAGAKFTNQNTPIDNIGYVYKRLQEPVLTGIYECNSRCKCKSNCLNRVVQHPLQTKLQVFKTSNRGWGIRCLNDVSKGSFICIYSGHLLTEEAGNNICQSNSNKAGDEYFADLDYIETVEQLKEGYEADVVESESENDSDGPDYDAKRDSDASDDDFTSSINPSDAAVKTRAQLRKDAKKSDKKSQKKKEDPKQDSDDAEREMISVMPNTDMVKGDVASPSIKYRSVRKLFGKHEQIYIMDAKKSGNLGRYFNHSCNPNLFVQNVFVDTHDLRFPWVAFFALSNIRAGSELTWNYNYDVGSVPGKVLYCQCGAENCRQRLL
uniref:Histone-lysine N-methyltransferase eggless n=2 Tax=Culex pipiens TaxID=7175 RepID=A0A8D8GAT4_CULPI